MHLAPTLQHPRPHVADRLFDALVLAALVRQGNAPAPIGDAARFQLECMTALLLQDAAAAAGVAQ